MEVDGQKSSAPGVASVTGGSVVVALHPLVIMNISEHWTRIRAQGRVVQVLGALIGKQQGRNIEIMNSFELVFHQIDNEVLIDREYYNIKEDQFKQVFSDLDFLGWYNIGEEVTESDIKLHQQICQINENPVFLRMNPMSKTSELPVNIYESVVDLVDKETKLRLVELPYVLATEEAERIGVDHVARLSSNKFGEGSTVSQHLMAQFKAVKMLHSRLSILHQYLSHMHQGLVPKNHEILREVNSLCHRMPVMNSPLFRADLQTQHSDVILMTYLGTLTKTCNTLCQYVNKFNVVNDRQVSRRVRGILY